MLDTSEFSNLETTLELGLEKAKSLLQSFAGSQTAQSDLVSLYATSDDMSSYVSDFVAGTSLLDDVEILPAGMLSGYDGAYAASTDKIYISDALLGSRNLDRIADVLLEELGHRIDAKIKSTDTFGDEGRSFSALIRGEAVPAASLSDAKGTITLDGVETEVEFAVSVSDSGGFEGSSQSLTLEGTEGGVITYRYEHFTIPDRFIIRYDGATLFDTGFTGGRASGEIELPAGTSDQLEIRVATNDEGTAWNYDVSVETCPEPLPYVVESQGEDFEFDADTGKCSADATVTIGHKQGTNPLLRATNSSTSFDRNSIAVNDATVFATIGGVSESLFSGSFTLNTATRTGSITETADGAFKLAQLDTEFKSVTVLQDKLAFDVAFTLPDEAGGGLVVDTVRVFDDALLIDSDGAKFRAGGKISLPDIVDFKLLNLLQVKASDISLEYRAAEDALRFQSKLELSDFAKLKAVKKITADLSGSNYVQINSDTDIDIVGKLKIGTDIDLVKGWSLSGIELTLNTVSNEIGGSATIGMPFGLKIGGDSTAKPSLEFFTDPFELDAVGLAVDNLNKPIPSYPLFFFQGFNGKIDNFAPSNPKDIEFSGGIGATFGPQLNGTFLGRMDGNVKIDAESIKGTVDVKILNVKFAAFGKDLGTFTAVQGSNSVELDWSKGELDIDGTLTALDGLFTFNNGLTLDTNANFSAYGTATVGIPGFVPLVGGVSLANGNFAINFTNDGNYGNDYVAGWGQITISKFGIEFDITAGLRANFDGSMSRIGFGNLPPVGSWEVPADEDFILLSAEWENASPDTKVTVELPDGTILQEADFAANNIAVVEELSTDTSRTVILVAPPAGIYDLLVDDPTGLGEVSYLAVSETAAPTLSITAVNAVADGTVDIFFDAFDADSDATITFWYDDDLTSLNGQLIGTALEADGSGSINWDAVTAVPGDYFVYALIDDGESITVVDSFDTAVTVGSQTDLGVTLDLVESAIGGNTVTLDVRVENLGTTLARSAAVLLTLPSELTLADPLPGNVVEEDGSLRISLGDIAGGDLGTISFELQTDAVTETTPVTVDAYVLADTYDGVTENDTDIAGMFIEPPSTAEIDLSVTQALVTPDPIVIGDPLAYEITITNAGPDAAQNVVLTETIVGLTGVTFSEPSTTLGGNSFALDLGTLAAGESKVITVTGTSAKVGTVQSFSAVEGDGTESELTLFDNESTGLFSVQGLPPEPADLSVAMVATEPDIDGQTTVSVTISNDGPGVGSNVETQITIPDGFEIVGFSTVQGSFDQTTGIWSLGNIRDNLSRTLDITLDGSEAVGILDISAEIIGVDEEDPDSTPGNGDPAEDDFASVSLQYATLIGTDDGEKLVGTGDDDFVLALGGNDRIYLKDGNDRLRAGDGNDLAYGGKGNDDLRGEAGRDILIGNDGDDSLLGGADKDKLYGGRGNDALFGDEGNDYLNGSSGNDAMSGGAGDDYMRSYRGTNSFDGGEGNDRMFAGWGDDTFVFEAGDGQDKIYYFNTREDVIDLTDFGFASYSDIEPLIHRSWFSTRIDLGDDQSITLKGWKHLDEDNFLL